MKIKVYQMNLRKAINDTFGHRYIDIMIGKLPGEDDLRNIYELTCIFNVKDVSENILEEIFVFLNRDDRPNGQYHKSLSVGDIIEFGDNLYLCLNIGFKKLNVNMNTKDIIEHDNVLEMEIKSFCNEIMVL